MPLPPGSSSSATRAGSPAAGILPPFRVQTPGGASTQFNIGYGRSALILGAAIGADRARLAEPGSQPCPRLLDAYILTRPLGASIGDFLSQPRDAGGLGLGTTVTSLLFLGTILGVVIYLTRTRQDQLEARVAEE